MDRLKAFNLKAQYTTREDRSNNKWFIVFLDRYKSPEEATRHGNSLVRGKIIQSFIIFSNSKKEETPVIGKEQPPPSLVMPPKEAEARKEKEAGGSIYFGPIIIKQEESGLRINILIEKRIFPEISSDKTAEGSRLLIVFKAINRTIVPVEFDKIQSEFIKSVSLAPRGPDCTFVVLLNSSYNYEVSQDYYEKEKMYSLNIVRKPLSGGGPPPKK